MIENGERSVQRRSALEASARRGSRRWQPGVVPVGSAAGARCTGPVAAPSTTPSYHPFCPGERARTLGWVRRSGGGARLFGSARPAAQQLKTSALRVADAFDGAVEEPAMVATGQETGKFPVTSGRSCWKLRHIFAIQRCAARSSGRSHGAGHSKPTTEE